MPPCVHSSQTSERPGSLEEYSMTMSRKIIVALAVLALGLALPAAAGVPKVVFFDEFGATW